MSKIRREQILHHSGFGEIPLSLVAPVRNGKYRVCDQAIMGDAPKDFIQIYRYGQGRRSSPQKWPAFIAKVGHKWYPNESITEQLLTEIGELLGLRMAQSELRLVNGQLRLCSRYFLNAGESLVHGAELFIGYLEDKELVRQIEDQNEARTFFTFQFVEDALLNRFPNESYEIHEDFVRMLTFDAIVGNNDRHYYNWGVVVHPEGLAKPRFSPIYDTARALFWNMSDARVAEMVNGPDYHKRLKKYAEKSRPKIGWETCLDINHFELIGKIARASENCAEIVRKLTTQPFLERVEGLLEDTKFVRLLTFERRKAILDCLRFRLHQIGVQLD